MSPPSDLHLIQSGAELSPPWDRFAPTGWRAFWIKLGQTTPLGRGSLRRFWVKQLRKQGELIDTQVGTARLRLHLGDNRSEIKALQQADDFMAEERHILRQAGEATQDEALYVVDIGANAGLFTAMAAVELANRAQIIAIEPNPVLQERLTANCQLCEAAQIHIAKVAIGAEAGELQLAFKADDLGGASFAKGQLSGDVDRIAVPIRTLLSVLQEAGFPRIDVLKVDVEGFEDQALVPFFEVADPAVWPRIILMEVAHQAKWASPLVQQRQQAGYRVEQRSGSADVTLHLETARPWPGAAHRSNPSGNAN